MGLSSRSIVLLVSAEGLGHGDRELRLTLAQKYFALLAQNDILPNAICFYPHIIEAQFSAGKVITI